jgi:hypothetical protein
LRVLNLWGFQGVGLLHTTCGTPNYIAPEVCGTSSVFSIYMKWLQMLVLPKDEGKYHLKRANYTEPQLKGH